MIYALFGDFLSKKCLFGSKTVFLGQEVHYDMVYIAYFSELILQICDYAPLVAGAWTERKKMYHGGSFLKLADDNMDIQNPEAQNRAISGF